MGVQSRSVKRRQTPPFNFTAYNTFGIAPAFPRPEVHGSRVCESALGPCHFYNCT